MNLRNEADCTDRYQCNDGSIKSKSNLHWLFKKLINGEFQLIVSNDILLEYEEQIAKRYGKSVVTEFLLIMSEAPNILQVEPFYKWDLIKADPDDNKFVDCAVSAAADYIITHDKHFEILREIEFPAINVIDAFGFEKILNQAKG